MSPNSDTRRILDFLADLKENNGRAWFEENRARYAEARGAFMALVAELLEGLSAMDELGGVTPAECVFRINRDVRFSRDKSPYKTNMGALMGRAGRKSGARAYYFGLEPGGSSILAGGLYEPTSAELAALRESIARDSKPLRRILEAPDFARLFGGLAGDSLKTAPQGYSRDHPAIDLLRRKQFFVVRPLSDAVVTSAKLIPQALEVYRAMRPFLLYLEKVVG